jgi:hypothetical protein
MNKSSVCTSLLLFLFISIVSCKKESEVKADLLDFMPARVALVGEIPDAFGTLSKWKEGAFDESIEAFPLGERVERFLDALTLEKDFTQDLPIVFYIAPSGASRFDVLIALSSENSAYFQEAFEWNVADSRDYSSKKIYSLSTQNEQELFSTEIRGVLLLSSSSILLEEAIRKDQSSLEIELPAGFKKLKSNSNTGSSIQLFVNTTELKLLWSYTFSQISIPDFIGVEGWMSFDLVLRNTEILLSGILEDNLDSNPPFISTGDGNSLDLETLIPATAVSWSIWNDVQLPTSKSTSRFSEWETRSFPTGYYSLVNNSSESYLQKVGFTKIEKETGLDFLPNGMRDSLQTELYRDNRISLLPRKINTKGLFTGMRKDFEIAALLELDGILYLSETTDPLKSLVNDYESGNMIASELDIEAYSDFPSGKAHWHAGAKNPNLSNLLLSAVNGKGMPSLRNTEESLSELHFAAISIQKKSNKLFLKAMIKSGSAQKESVSNQWTLGLEQKVIWGPHLLPSHLDNSQEIWVQDAGYTVYHIHPSGKILWKASLDGPILGPPAAIDRYKNLKYQYVFNTTGQLYGFDRNGGKLDGFPIAFSKAATAGLSVFDYDKNRNYRILVPVGKEILNFSAEGKEVKGWKPSPMPDVIETPLLYMLSGGKDYILSVSKDGSIRTLDRTGKSKWKKDVVLPLMKDNQWWISSQGNEKLDGITGLSANGKLAYVFMNGNTDLTDVAADWFRLFDGKGIRIIEDKIEYETSKGLIEIPKSKYPWQKVKPLIYESRNYVFAFQADKEALHLFNQRGELVNGFPVYAEGDFVAGDLQKKGKLQIIVIGSNGSIVSYSFEPSSI